MDVNLLPPEVRSKIFSYLDISSLVEAADVCTTWRKDIETEKFLDDFSKSQFGFGASYLPTALPSDRLLIDTWRLKNQGSDGKYLGTQPTLLRILALHIRSKWFPWTYEKELIKNDIDRRSFKYPWPYKEKLTKFYADTLKFSQRFHAAFPTVYEWILSYSSQSSDRDIGIDYYPQPRNYPDLLHEQMDEWANGPFEFEFEVDREPAVIDLMAENEERLLIFLFKDDQTFKIMNCDIVGGDPNMSAHISVNASIDVIRQQAGEIIQTLIPKPRSQMKTDTCPEFGWVKMGRNAINKLQSELRGILASTITTSADGLTKKLLEYLKDYPQQQTLQRKLIPKLDNSYLCRSLNHPECPKRKRKSPRMSIAILRALRRLINDRFMGEVQTLYEDPITCKIAHAWTFMEKGRNKDICFDTGCPREFNIKEKCFMKVAAKDMCAHLGYPEIWPATVLKKAIDKLPDMVEKLQAAVIAHISSCVDKQGDC